MTTTEPTAAAASLFVAAFNAVYEDDPYMTITLHTGSGSELAVTGELDNYRMRFDPDEVDTLLAGLTRSVATDPYAVITVTADREGQLAQGWAWYVRGGAALNRTKASRFFTTAVELLGPAQPHVRLGGTLVELTTGGLSATALTSDVKAAVIAHAQPKRPDEQTG